MATEDELRAAEQRESTTADTRVSGAEPRADDRADGDAPRAATEDAEAPTQVPAGDSDRTVRWWHRDHPTFTAICGFFTGLVYVIVLPGVFAAILGAVFDYETAEELFPFVLIIFALPLALLVSLKTRRFGKYMLFGMVTTAIVVLAVAALTLWILIKIDN